MSGYPKAIDELKYFRVKMDGKFRQSNHLIHLVIELYKGTLPDKRNADKERKISDYEKMKDETYRAVKDFLDNNCNPDDNYSGRGHTPLALAAIKNDVELAKLLVEYGADVNKGSTSWEIPPLVYAVEAAQYDIAKFLLENEADPNLTHPDYSGTPLQWACKNSDLEMTELLLQFNADPKAVSFNEKSPIEMTKSMPDFVALFEKYAKPETPKSAESSLAFADSCGAGSGKEIEESTSLAHKG